MHDFKHSRTHPPFQAFDGPRASPLTQAASVANVANVMLPCVLQLHWCVRCPLSDLNHLDLNHHATQRISRPLFHAVHHLQRRHSSRHCSGSVIQRHRLCLILAAENFGELSERKRATTILVPFGELL